MEKQNGGKMIFDLMYDENNELAYVLIVMVKSKRTPLNQANTQTGWEEYVREL